MSETKSVRLNKLVREFNVSIDRIYSFLESKGIEDLKPNTKVSHEIYMELLGEFDSEKKAKLSADLLAKEKELERAEEIIIEMVFQLGRTGVKKFRNMWKALSEHNYVGASYEMLDSKWAKQTPNRAKAMAEQMKACG